MLRWPPVLVQSKRVRRAVIIAAIKPGADRFEKRGNQDEAMSGNDKQENAEDGQRDAN